MKEPPAGIRRDVGARPLRHLEKIYIQLSIRLGTRNSNDFDNEVDGRELFASKEENWEDKRMRNQRHPDKKYIYIYIYILFYLKKEIIR